MAIKVCFPIILFFSALISCGGERQAASPDYTITTKTIAVASNSKGCKDCMENDIECCVMHYGDKHLIRNQTYVLDSIGQAIKVYDYMMAPGLGAVIYEKSNMPPEYESYFQIKKQMVKWVADKKMVIDNNDTILAVEIIPEHHVIIADGSGYSQSLIAKGNVVVYTYK